MSTIATFSRQEFIIFWNKFIEIAPSLFPSEKINRMFSIFSDGQDIPLFDKKIKAKDIPGRSVGFGFPEHPRPLVLLYPYFKDMEPLKHIFEIWGVCKRDKHHKKQYKNDSQKNINF